MEVTQFTYFQQVMVCPANRSWRNHFGLGTFGKMALQSVDSMFDLQWTDSVTYGDVFKQQEVEMSAPPFVHADVGMLFEHFAQYEKPHNCY